MRFRVLRNPFRGLQLFGPRQYLIGSTDYYMLCAGCVWHSFLSIQFSKLLQIPNLPFKPIFQGGEADKFPLECPLSYIACAEDARL